MSTTTDVLSLFKYDPVADADSTFNITQGLNNNWDKLDTALLLAIAAAGAYNPEESYAVGDYCTYKGKLRKCSTAIPTGETWTEAHWTTTTVAAELAELSSQLSNKVSITNHGSSNTSLLDTSLSDGVNICSNWADCPPDVTDDQGNCLVITYLRFAEGQYWGRRIYFPANDGNAIYVNNCSIGVWQGWERITTDVPPQEFDLPLAEGWNGWVKYSKDQFGRVLVYGLVAKSTALLSGDVIGTFPEGFRPSQTCPMTITSNNSTDGKSFATSGYVQPSGVFTLTNGIISSGYNVGNNIAFNFVFPAAS